MTATDETPFISFDRHTLERFINSSKELPIHVSEKGIESNEGKLLVKKVSTKEMMNYIKDSFTTAFLSLMDDN